MKTKRATKQKPLFIFEMANNHQGFLEHGLKILREFKEISKNFDFDFGFKLQYRDIPTFIHPDYKDRMDLKYVRRFSETLLAEKDAQALKKEMDKLGFISICTAFDENSIDLIEKHDYDIIKIGSCSFTDWSLLERIVKTDKPIIASAAGIPLKNIDSVVSFFTHRNKDFTLMHCVGKYPTPHNQLQLNQIDLFKGKYPHIKVGYSTHEEPNNLDSIKMAIAKGASVFEKHVGVETDEIKLNAYSVTPEQAKNWLFSAKEAFDTCGIKDKRMSFSKKELADLGQFKRAVFAKRDIKKGENLDWSNLFLAWPKHDGQVLANDMSKYVNYQAKKAIKKNRPVFFKDVNCANNREKVYKIIVKARKMLDEAKIALPERLDVEVSHHYGIDKFNKVGAILINCINREYCKKLILLMPNQSHPTHLHKKKEEAFHVLYGDLQLNLNGEKKNYQAGDIVVVSRDVKHSFASKKGAIFEEVSTTHYKNDSFYEDKSIEKNPNRKTKLTYWTNID